MGTCNNNNNNNNNNNTGSSYITHFTNVSMRFTISGGLFGLHIFNAQWQQLTIMRDN
jgi:hypothetical protein